jgi:hypothetical protein
MFEEVTVTDIPSIDGNGEFEGDVVGARDCVGNAEFEFDVVGASDCVGNAEFEFDVVGSSDGVVIVDDVIVSLFPFEEE